MKLAHYKVFQATTDKLLFGAEYFRAYKSSDIIKKYPRIGIAVFVFTKTLL